MPWKADLHPKFQKEIDEFPRCVRVELLSSLKPLSELGPNLGRPMVDTLKGSSYPNMKELRFKADGGVWRVAFAFNPQRTAIILVAGDKSGVSPREFYRQLIDKADRRYRDHLNKLES